MPSNGNFSFNLKTREFQVTSRLLLLIEKRSWSLLLSWLTDVSVFCNVFLRFTTLRKVEWFQFSFSSVSVRTVLLINLKLTNKFSFGVKGLNYSSQNWKGNCKRQVSKESHASLKYNWHCYIEKIFILLTFFSWIPSCLPLSSEVLFYGVEWALD